MKQKRITAVLVDTEKEIFGIVNIPNELDAFYKVLGCRCIDITTRRIGKTVAEIICDDEGLLVEAPKISAINNLGEAQLAGSILIVGNGDSDGNLTSLSNEDANHILSCVQLLSTRKIKKPVPDFNTMRIRIKGGNHYDSINPDSN